MDIFWDTEFKSKALAVNAASHFCIHSVWNKLLYISRFGCKQGPETLIITHFNYGLKYENLIICRNIQPEEFFENK